MKGPHLFRYYNPQPSKVAAAEKAFAKFLGVKHVLAVNSCTSALIAALRALGIGMGDEVIVPAYTFFASAAVIGACNAIPVIADVDDTLTLDPKDVERKITPRTRAIIVVHMRGKPAQMDELMAIAGAAQARASSRTWPRPPAALTRAGCSAPSARWAASASTTTRS